MFQEMIFKELNHIKELQNIDREQFMAQLIAERLDKSLNTYCQELTSSEQLLSTYNTLKVSKRLLKVKNV